MLILLFTRNLRQLGPKGKEIATKASVILLMGGLTIGLASSTLVQGDDLLEWHQGFEVSTFGWFTDAKRGPFGWCGDIEQHNVGSGPAMPSEGNGYATVMFGGCNDYWSENGFPNGSGPFGLPGGHSAHWPEGGFSHEIDIFLNEDWDEGNIFRYKAGVRKLNETPLYLSFRYFQVSIRKMDDGFFFSGQTVSEPGWYTFRHTFENENGHLAGRFELVQDDEIVFEKEETTTSGQYEDISTYDIENVGTGELWFQWIRPGTKVAIDEHWYRPNASR